MDIHDDAFYGNNVLSIWKLRNSFVLRGRGHNPTFLRKIEPFCWLLKTILYLCVKKKERRVLNIFKCFCNMNFFFFLLLKAFFAVIVRILWKLLWNHVNISLKIFRIWNDFYDMPNHLGLFYAQRLRSCIHCMFIFTLFISFCTHVYWI